MRNEKRLAKVAYKERDFSKAVRLNRSLLATYGSNLSGEEAAAINLDLGVCLLRLGELDDAPLAFAAAVRLDPANERAKFLDAEWSGKLPVIDEEPTPMAADDAMLDFTSAPSGSGAAQMIDPLGSGSSIDQAPGGVLGVPHAERRPPFAWRLLTPIICVVIVCIIVMVLRSL